ncbi:MAG: DNA-processing protein DprA [Rhodospirillaceae bacterium]|nr:DNA-processing protein DprA [Rhodospirillaceae bacterium]
MDPRAAIEKPELLPFKGRTGEKLRTAIRALTSAEVAEAHTRAEEQLRRAERYSAKILVHGDAEYPKHVYASNNPEPILYVRGDPAVWASGCSVAVVGSRKTREPYSSSARKFATTAARQGVVVISGFAMGADSIGHSAAQEAGGGTVCVMPCGLDKVFPPENRSLWEGLLAYSGAVFVSQFGFGQRASSLQLRKRNKLIVAFAQGIVVVQSAVDGGAMNAYRFGLEQKKPVATFKADELKDTSGNAAIVKDPRTGGVAFEPTSDESEYKTWLRRLSS